MLKVELMIMIMMRFWELRLMIIINNNKWMLKMWINNNDNDEILGGFGLAIIINNNK